MCSHLKKKTRYSLYSNKVKYLKCTKRDNCLSPSKFFRENKGIWTVLFYKKTTVSLSMTNFTELLSYYVIVLMKDQENYNRVLRDK